MQKTEKVAVSAHRRVKSSTTLNRKYVKRPTKNTDVMVSVKKSPQIKRFSTSASQQMSQMPTKKMPSAKATDMAPAQTHPMQATARTRMQARTAPQVSKMTASQLKDQAIKKALASANRPTMAEQVTKTDQSQKKTGKMRFGIGRVMLALSCAAAAVFAIAYFVNLNMPDISLRVAAMQTGINASYPGYVPRDYKLSGITSEEGKVSLNFKNSTTGENFTIVEEKSSWDSNALLSNYVKDAYAEDYSIIREQGLTIYVSKSNATWVNGGTVYKLTADDGSLVQRQIRSIAVSL